MLTRREIITLCLVFLITLPAVTSRLYASDEIEYFAWLRSAAFDHDVDFRNEYQHFYDAGVARAEGFYETFLSAERANEIGRPVNYATPGPGMLWSPFYAVGHLAAIVSGAPRDGFSHPYIAAIAYGSACYGFLATVISAVIARRVFGRGLAVSLAIACGTPLLFYAYVAPGFGHAASAFAVSLLVWVWLRVRARWTIGGAIALGLCAGLVGVVREQDVFLSLGPALDFLIYWFRSIRNGRVAASGARPSPAAVAVAGTLAFLAGLAPLLLAYKALNGHFFPTETAARKMTWTAPHAWGVLFSPYHGLFAWTPLAIVAIAGLAAVALAARTTAVGHHTADGDARRIAIIALIMIAAQAYSSGSVESWTVAGSFGQRRFVAITPLLVLGLAGLFALVQATWPRRALAAVIALCIWWNLGLMAQFGLHRMDRQQLTLMDNARATFVDLPLEAPQLVWRYLFDRQSLYKLPRASQKSEVQSPK
ncbi:MAG TPA: hypothetical protein VFV78_02670 [Vicinamibacterales bacterium]|nr:hypothetical protein [Vicinamibacterales bacterium]